MDSKNKFRLYVDETGNSSYPRRLDAEVGKRYLALTGIAISDYEYTHVLRPRIEEMKYLITGDRDEKITLHRDEIKDRTGAYSVLLNKSVERQWNELIFVWPTYKIVAAKKGYTTRIPFSTTAEIRQKSREVLFK